MRKCFSLFDAIFTKLLVLRLSKMYLCNWYIYNYSGAIAISVIPLLADYVSHKSRGTSAAFLVLMSSLGALTSAYINFTLLNNVSSDKKIFLQYGIISSIIIVIGLLYTGFCLKAGNDYYTRGGNQRRSIKDLVAVAK